MGLFEGKLEQHETERHVGILGTLMRLRKGPSSLAHGDDGFLPPHQAAEAMNVGEAELVDMVHGGLLEWREVRGEVYVRPAVARLLGVKT